MCAEGSFGNATSLQGIVVDSKDCTPALLWSKTTQTTGSVGGTWEDPTTCKMGTFFLMFLTLTEPSLKNFQLNGEKMF